MKAFKKLIMSMMILACVSGVSGQVQKTNFVFLGTNEVKTGTDHVQAILVDTENQKYILWFNNITPSSSESNLPENVNNSESGIYDMNGTRFLLKPWEMPVKFTNDTLITQLTPHFKKGDFYLYVLSSTALTLKQSRLQLESSGIMPLKSGFYLSTNQDDGPASQAALLGRDLQDLGSIQGLFPAFTMQFHDEYKGELLLNVTEAAGQGDSVNCRFLSVNSSSGDILRQMTRKFDARQAPYAFMNENALYIQSFNHAAGSPLLQAYSFNGSLLWSKDVSVDPRFLSFCRNRKIALITGNDGLKTLTLNNGQIIWDVTFEAIRAAILAKFPAGKLPDKLMGNVLATFDTDDKNPCFVLRVSDYSDGPNEIRIIKANYFVLIKSDGSIQDIMNYGSTPEMLEVYNVRGELWVLDEKNLNRYEIIKN